MSRDLVIRPFSTWRNRKTGKLYRVVRNNATNAQDGQVMVSYYPASDLLGFGYSEKPHVREKVDFLKKFIRMKEKA